MEGYSGLDWVLQPPGPGGPKNVVLESMQPKRGVVCPCLNVAVGWGFAAGWGFASCCDCAAGWDFTGDLEFAASEENAPGKAS